MLTALLVTSASTLFESAPFVLAALVLTQTPVRWNARIGAYLGCGCGVGPSARSLPAAAATCFVFGPLVAGARLAAAILVDRFTRSGNVCAHRRASLLSELHLLAPVAALGAAAALVLPALAGYHIAGAAAFLSGAAGALVLAPCALGSVAFAASLRAIAPASAAGFLCIAGILDLRTWLGREGGNDEHDVFAYGVFSLACALVALRGGAQLVHPKIALALWACAAAGAAFAYRFRDRRCAKLRVAPLVMLAGTFLAAPLPAYHATETSLADAFAGERVDFTGVLTRTRDAATLVRYAITCCRADAAPVVVRLLDTPPRSLHGWIHAHGVLVGRGHRLFLKATLVTVSAPADPFVYR